MGCVLVGMKGWCECSADCVCVWHVADGETYELVAEKKVAHGYVVKSVCFSGDGKRIATGGGKAVKVSGTHAETEGSGVVADGGVCVCADAKTLEIVAEQKGAHGDRVMSICFSCDGGRIASGGSGGAIKLWGMCAK